MTDPKETNEEAVNSTEANDALDQANETAVEQPQAEAEEQPQA